MVKSQEWHIARRHLFRFAMCWLAGLRQAREKLGWSQADLARELQLRGWDAGRTLITKIELRERCVTDYELIVLARVLSVRLDDLTKGSYEESLLMAQTAD